MRISGGQLKGRKIASQKVFSKKGNESDLRPTSSKVREALFDILKYKIGGSSFLDLYAGTGTVGFEALSRGAERACFVEGNARRSQSMKDVVLKIGLGERAFVYTRPALDFLRSAAKSGMRFDIIFADPPYASDEIATILPLIDELPVLNEGGCLMIEHPSKSPLHALSAASFVSLKFIKNYRYGDTMLTLLRKQP